MASKTIYLAVTVEEKEEDGRLPRSGEAGVQLCDILADATRREYELPWRVTSVIEVAGLNAGNTSS